jgi:hypothetical protein
MVDMNYTTYALEAVTRLDQCLEIIAKYVARLKADPDRAASKLSDALDEVEKSCRSVDDAVAQYLGLGFSPEQLKESSTLLQIGGGALLITVQRGLGSCHKIRNIYENDLNRWFERVFKKDTASYKDLEKVFTELNWGDQSLFQVMGMAAERVQFLANEALDLAKFQKYQEAQRQILSSLSELNPLRQEINKLLAKLFGLRVEFIEISGVG